MKPETAALVKLVDKAIAKVDSYVPITDRVPTADGGRVRSVAVGILVAGSALLGAYVELEAEFDAIESSR